MGGFTDFFGSDEWNSIFIASIFLISITLLFIFFKILLYVALVLFIIAGVYSFYKIKKGRNVNISSRTVKNFFKR